MLQLPSGFYQQISVFASSFHSNTWKKAQLLLIGAILCPGSRTVCNVLRVLGLKDKKGFDQYHAVLYRAKWSALKLSVVLLKALVPAFVPAGEPLVFGVDETIERRWGSQISKRGIYRDAVRSSAAHLVKCSGLRWMSVMLLTNLPWLETNRYWALPFLTALCPSKRFYNKREQSRAPKKLTDWARQVIVWLGRYAKPLGRPLFLVGDGSYATYELMLKAQQEDVNLIARMKMNARLFAPPAPQPPGKRGRKPKIGKRLMSMKKRLTDKRIKWQKVTFSDWYGARNKTMLVSSGTAIWDSNKGKRVALKWVLIKDPDGKLDPVLLGCSNNEICVEQIIRFFVRRWRVEVTFGEVRRHLGVETQRQWSDLSIERTTPVLMALKSIVCLLANVLFEKDELHLQHTVWYQKGHFTFSDVLCAVRQQLWAKTNFPTSEKMTYVGKLKQRIEYLEQALLLAAA